MDNEAEKTANEQVNSEPAEDKTKVDEKSTSESNTEVTNSEPPTEELLEKIKKQVEFYFGDINMQRDKFLIEQSKLEDGWIPMSVMLNFKLLVSMSKDPEVILKAIESSELMEISEDRKKIRRSPKHPLPVYDEAYRKSQIERTVYVKGFPLTGMTIQILKDFLKEYEPIENIVMRKYQDKEKQLKFKGSIFVQFKTLEGAKKFMETESIKYNETELIKKWSEEYAVQHAEEQKLKKLKKSEKNVTVAPPAIGLPRGSVVHFSGAGEKTSRETVTAALKKLDAEVAFIDYTLGNPEGWVRLQSENSASVLLEKMTNGELMVEKDKLVFKVVEGEEEKKYLEEAEKKISTMRSKAKMAKRGRSKKGGGGKRGKRRNASPAEGSTPAKKIAST